VFRVLNRGFNPVGYLPIQKKAADYRIKSPGSPRTGVFGIESEEPQRPKESLLNKTQQK
jgi:hypothetical protein